MIQMVNSNRLHLTNILKEDRNLTIDKLTQIKLLVKNCLQSVDLNVDLPQLLILYIQKMMKMHKLNFQFTLQLFLFCFILFLQCETDSRKLSESVYKLFYSILALPIEIKDRKHLLSDPAYMNFSDPVKLDKQQQAEKKIMILLKYILEASTHGFRNKDLVYKIYGLAKKAAEKEFGHLFINIFIPYYLSKIQSALSNTEQQLLHIHQIANILMLKFKYQTHQVIEKIIKWCPVDRLPVLITYFLLQCLLRKENIVFYANFLLHQHILNNIKQHYAKLIEFEVNLSQIPISTIINTSFTKISFQTACTLMIACVFARTYESQEIFCQFIQRLRNSLKPFDIYLDDMYDKILLQIYLHGFQFNVSKIEINFYKLTKTFKSYKHALLPFFIIRDSIQYLPSFLNQISKTLEPTQLSYFFQQLDDLGQIIFIINTIRENPTIFQYQLIQLLIQYNMLRKFFQISNELIFYLLHYWAITKNQSSLDNLPYAKYIFYWIGDTSDTIQYITRIPLHRIAYTQRFLINRYFAFDRANNSINHILKLLHKLSSTEQGMNSLIDYIFKYVMEYDPSMINVNQDTQFLQLSSVLFEQIGITIATNQIQKTQKQFIAKAIILIEFLLPSAQAAIKKAIALYLDNLSDISIKDIILPNRFLLRCMVYSSKNKFKNLLQAILKCENKDEYLQILFPDQPPTIRIQYSKFLIQRITTLQFRVFLSDFEELLLLADSKQSNIK